MELSADEDIELRIGSLNEDTNNNANNFTIEDVNNDENEPVDYDPMELAEIVALIDIGSYMMRKNGKAGASAQEDHLPYFASMRRRWYFVIWEGNPDEWRVVCARDKSEDPYSPNFKSDEAPIYLKDITDIYLEPPPNLGIRLYKNNEVIQLSPLSYSLKESTAWADAFRAAFVLQDMPRELTAHVRQAYYDAISNQQAPTPSTYRHGRDLEVYREEDETVLGGDQNKSQLNQTDSSSQLVPPDTGSIGCFQRLFGRKSK